jgi:hypothetical protein
MRDIYDTGRLQLKWRTLCSTSLWIFFFLTAINYFNIFETEFFGVLWVTVWIEWNTSSFYSLSIFLSFVMVTSKLGWLISLLLLSIKESIRQLAEDNLCHRYEYEVCLRSFLTCSSNAFLELQRMIILFTRLPSNALMLGTTERMFSGSVTPI